MGLKKLNVFKNFFAIIAFIASAWNNNISLFYGFRFWRAPLFCQNLFFKEHMNTDTHTYILKNQWHVQKHMHAMCKSTCRLINLK